MTDAVTAAWNADQVGVRLSRLGINYGSNCTDPPAIYDHVMRLLSDRIVACLYVIRPNEASHDTGPL